MKKISGSIYSLIALMVIMVAVIIISLEYEDIRTKSLPLIFSSLIFVLAAVRLRIELKYREKQKETTDSDDALAAEMVCVEQAAQGEWNRYFIAAAWVFGFVLETYLFGFIPAMLITTFWYTRTQKLKWRTSILLTILTPAIIWFCFEFALRVTLERGLIYTLLGY
jgi:hypothetical protein